MTPKVRSLNVWCGRGDSNPTGPLIPRKLFIPCSDKSDKNDRNAEVRYTAGTQKTPRFHCMSTRSSAEVLR